MTAISAGARGTSAGWLFGFLLLAGLAAGCDDRRGYYYGYGPGYGPGYGAPRATAIRFEWSVASESSADAGAMSDADGGAIEPSPDAGTKASSSNQSACDALGATMFQVLLYDRGSLVDAFQSKCSATSDTFRVHPSAYTATATLVDNDGVPVSETETVASFTVNSGDTHVVSLTFKKLASSP